jgi:hypothetical protein
VQGLDWSVLLRCWLAYLFDELQVWCISCTISTESAGAVRISLCLCLWLGCGGLGCECVLHLGCI